MRDMFSKTPSFDFLGKQKFFFALSSIIMIASLYVWFSKGPDKYGIDFLGGHELVVRAPNLTSAEATRAALAKEGIEGATVKAYEGASTSTYSVRVQRLVNESAAAAPDSTTTTAASEEARGESEVVKDKVLKALKQSGADDTTAVLSAEYIGPTVGAELRRKGLWAVAIGLLGILAYVALRFEFAFALGAVVALAHDVIFAVGVYLLFGYTINMETLAAALTIVGYSVNDTIVIFDRVREEILEERPGTLSEIVNRSINAMLSRTLITHMLTTISVISLLVLGSGAIRDMSAFLLVGLISGSYSTMYIASPITIAWHKMRGGTEQV